MKKNLLKFYIAAFYLCSNFMMFAAPGVEDEDNNLESVDPPVPVDDYVWAMVILGLVFVYFKYKSLKMHSNN